MKLHHFIFFIFFISVFSCRENNKLEKEISNLDMDIEVERFDKLLANASVEDLTSLKKVYPFLFPKVLDSLWLDRFNGDIQQQVFNEVMSSFDDFSDQQVALEDFFKHLKYYDSNSKSPRIITLADYVDYRTKLVSQQDLLLINLSNYLGATHEFYQNIPMYFSENMRQEQIIPEVAHKYAERYAFQNQRKTFLDEIVYQGKLLYFKEIMLPSYEFGNIIAYSEEDIEWAKINEPMIWSYFVEKEILYSTDAKLLQRFTVPGPFSKFGLEIDNESPPRLGTYIGWQIVKAYAERTKADILKIMRTDADEIFKTSKYKPKR